MDTFHSVRFDYLDISECKEGQDAIDSEAVHLESQYPHLTVVCAPPILSTKASITIASEEADELGRAYFELSSFLRGLPGIAELQENRGLL